jgi:phosphopantetheinyl transferase
MIAAADWSNLRDQIQEAFRSGEAMVITLRTSGAVTDTGVLSDDEAARARRYCRQQDRTNFVLGRTLVRRLLLGEGPGSRETLRLGPAGKPIIEGIDFNLSHSADRLALIASSVGSVGIDVESRTPSPAVMESIACTDERRLLSGIDENHRGRLMRRMWCRKEALLKAAGVGLLYPMNQIDADIGSCSPVLHFGSAYRVHDLLDDDNVTMCAAVPSAVRRVCVAKFL